MGPRKFIAFTNYYNTISSGVYCNGCPNGLMDASKLFIWLKGHCQKWSNVLLVSFYPTSLISLQKIKNREILRNAPHLP